jgi:hypothetical protein
MERFIRKNKNRDSGPYLLHMRNSNRPLFGVPGVRAFQKITFNLFSLGKFGNFERLPQDSWARDKQMYGATVSWRNECDGRLIGVLGSDVIGLETWELRSVTFTEGV